MKSENFIEENIKVKGVVVFLWEMKAMLGLEQT